MAAASGTSYTESVTRPRRPRVFLDTNVFLSGIAFGSKGPPRRILDLYAAEEIDVVVCRQVLEELVRVIQERAPQALSSLEKLIANRPPEVLPDPAQSEVSPWTQVIYDPSDASILLAAVKARPDFLVTGDEAFFAPAVAQASRLCIVRPQQFIDWYDAHKQNRGAQG